MTETRQVQVPHSYFQKARSEYSDWRWAVIREFIQNSYDAQASTIEFRLIANAADRIELHVDDDGIGMDEDTLLNVLLCMGGSRKLEGSIGGKGWAKAILFFAHHGYTIRTGNLRVDGSGGEYRLTEEPTNIAGTRITVELSDESVLLDSWRERIRAYVASCFMEYATGRPVAISLDGVALTPEQRQHLQLCRENSAGNYVVRRDPRLYYLVAMSITGTLLARMGANA